MAQGRLSCAVEAMIDTIATLMREGIIRKFGKSPTVRRGCLRFASEAQAKRWTGLCQCLVGTCSACSLPEFSKAFTEHSTGWREVYPSLPCCVLSILSQLPNLCAHCPVTCSFAVVGEFGPAVVCWALEQVCRAHRGAEEC